MRFDLDDAQRELRRTARRFFADHSDGDAVRATMATDRGWDEALWGRVAGELGLAAIAVPEALGGFGLGAVELAVVAEEAGRSVACLPFLGTVGLALPVLLECGAPGPAQGVVGALAAGEATGAVAATAIGGAASTAVWAEAADGIVLSGDAPQVVDGATADHIVVEATNEDGELALLLVGGASPGLERAAIASLDQTRRLADLRFRDLRLASDRVLARGAAAEGALARALDRARITLAAEQLGGAARCLELSVAYAGERVQFGRPIGSFQAIKHTCADMLLQVESARSAVWWAASVADRCPTGAAAASAHIEGQPAEEALAEAAAIAATWCSEAAFRCAADALQVHGGIGFTWEHDVHLHLKRARASRALLGTPAALRERLAARLLDD